ncbi:hypothetical protein AVEN_92213-1 [Araneus ventricosus]|uniref:Uncharacterized protein n=1 Tax=Araneus ventricosus TaxID=182803 RepID=A0A4Y2AM14_ARAVE|nr:hypothetical protein AVEN_92213-1 [Araneus ventricosus]
MPRNFSGAEIDGSRWIRIVVLHDHARPQTVLLTQQMLQQYRWELFDQPAYDFDFGPSDYHLLLHLKWFLSIAAFPQ